MEGRMHAAAASAREDPEGRSVAATHTQGQGRAGDGDRLTGPRPPPAVKTLFSCFSCRSCGSQLFCAVCRGLTSGWGLALHRIFG